MGPKSRSRLEGLDTSSRAACSFSTPACSGGFDGANADTVVIVPVYNEAVVVEAVLRELVAQFRWVVAVDDGSKDGSAGAIVRAGAVLIPHPFNIGQGAAIQTGVEWARRHTDADYFITFDSDGQHSVDDASAMVAELRQGQVDVILGSRFLDRHSNVPPLKGTALRLARWLVNSTTGARLTDAHNGLRAFNRCFAEQLQLRELGMAHATEIISSLMEGGFRYREMPVNISYTAYSLGKGQRLINGVNILFDMSLRRMLRRK